MSFFLICTTTFMQLRWWLGSAFLAAPVLLMHYWFHLGRLSVPEDAVSHVVIAWAVGGLMSFLAEVTCEDKDTL